MPSNKKLCMRFVFFMYILFDHSLSKLNLENRIFYAIVLWPASPTIYRSTTSYLGRWWIMCRFLCHFHMPMGVCVWACEPIELCILCSLISSHYRSELISSTAWIMMVLYTWIRMQYIVIILSNSHFWRLYI